MNCSHPTIIDHTCIDCGQIADQPLVSVYSLVASAPPRLNYKYAISNMDFYLTNTIHRILAPLHKLEYTEEIKDIIQKKDFGKVSVIEKITATTYYVLKRDDFPIFMNDFKQIAKRGIKKLLKHVCKEFPYIYNTDEYIKAVIERIYLYLSTNGYSFDQHSLFLRIIRFYESHERCLIVVNVALYLLFEDGYEECFYRYNLAELTTLKGIEKIKRKFTVIVKEMKKRNNGLVQRVEGAFDRLYRNKNVKRIDEVDLYIERLFLNGYSKDTLKSMTLKEIKNMMQSSPPKTVGKSNGSVKF